VLSVRVIPCLDVAGARVVKGVRFADLRDAGDPAELARRYEREGADELVLLDVSATLAGRATARAVVRRVRAELSIPLTVGGGVRTRADAAALLAAGADRVAVNSAAVARPGLIRELADAFGTQCVVLALDARRVGCGHEVLVEAGRRATGLAAARWAREGERRGAGEILLTSHDRDGTGTGYDLALLAAVRRAVRLPLIASGGVRTAAHMEAAVAAGADALLAASIFHRRATSVGRVKAALARAGIPVRPRAPEENPR
jgi:cyclase